MEEKYCANCHTQLSYLGEQKIQLGKTGWILGDLPNLLAGALEAAIYTCPACGKIEFYQTTQYMAEEQIAQVKCPNCGNMHDCDYPKCPFCKYDYYSK